MIITESSTINPNTTIKAANVTVFNSMPNRYIKPRVIAVHTGTLVLATNGITSVQRGRIAATDTGKYFKAIVISEEVGAAKPDPAFFKIASEQSGNPAKENILMIGDSMTSDMRGAANYGIASCLIVPPHKEVPVPGADDPKPDFIIRNFDQLKEILR